MDVWRVYHAARRHKYMVALSVLVAVAGAVIVSLFLPRFYVATTTLLPSETAIRHNLQPQAEPAAAASSEVAASPRESRLANLIVLARSRSIADKVAARVHISAQSLMRSVSCQRVVNNESGVPTDMIAVTARMPNPDSAVEVANAWAAEFIKFQEEVSYREAVRTREFLEGLQRSARARLDAAASNLAAFRKQNRVSDLPSEITAALSELSPLRTERDAMRARVADINARLAVRRAQARSLSPVVAVRSAEPPAAAIDALRTQIGQARAELVKLGQTYTDEYYRVKQLRDQIATAQAEIDRLEKSTEPVVRTVEDPAYHKVLSEIKDLEADSRAGQARLARLDSVIAERESKLGAYSSVEIGLSTRKRTYDEAARRFDTVAEQVHTARINERLAAEANAIKLIDAARTADGPVHAGPSLIQLILSAVVLGSVIGLGVVVTLETLDTRVRTAADASELLELPVSGIIPSIPTDGNGRASSRLITQSAPMSPFAEPYRFLATDILLDTQDSDIRSIMVATAKPAQGGTSTVCNLAITLAQAGRRVVLIDADLRRPSLHRLFRVPNDPGLANLLRDGTTIEKTLKSTFVEGLAIVTAGTDIDNPWALLRSAKLARLIDELKHVADYVLVDVPSAIVFADAATVASVVDGIVVVVRANESPRGSEFQIKDLLNKANRNILGVVLTHVAPDEVDSCHYYARYYATQRLLKSELRESGRSPREQAMSAGAASSTGADKDEYALDDEGRV